MVQGEVRRVPSKTGRHNPKPVIVPLHPTLAAMLEETVTKGRSGAVLPGLCARYQRSRDLVSRQVQKHLTNCGVACHATGVQAGATGDADPMASGKVGTRVKRRKAPTAVEVGFHSLRHSFVSLCRAADVPLSVVESIVGHSSPAMTRHYTHTGDVAARLAVNTLPDVTALLGEADSTTKDSASTKEAAEVTLLEEVARLAEGLTSKNAATTRKALLALVRGGGAE
jgi:integrase